MDSEDRSHPQNVEYSGDNAESNTDSSENSEYTWESTYVYEDSSGEYSGSSYTCYSSDSIFCSDELSEPTSDDVDATKVTSGSREGTAISGSSGTDAPSGTQITDDSSKSFSSKVDVTLMPSCSGTSADDQEDPSATSSVSTEDQKVDEECKPKVTVRTQMPQNLCKVSEKRDVATETSGCSRETITSNTDSKHDEHTPVEQCKSNKTVTTQMPQNIGKIPEEHDDKPETSSVYHRNKAIEDIDRLLLDHRTSIKNELEQLKLGNKPVTGQGHKEAVESFFSRSQDSEDVIASEHRPKKISREVSALVDSRRVSSLLQSDRFMKRLESTLSGALGSRGKGKWRRMSWAGPYDQPASSNQSTPPLRRRHSLHHSLISGRCKSDSRLTAHQAPVGEQTSTSETDERSVTPCSSNLSIISEEDAVAQAKRQQRIGDINELVERELVKSSLEGKFRKNLERLMGNHLHHTNTDGKRVERFIKSLPPSRQERNDFSHLDQNTSRQSQDNSGLSEEVAALKSQLGEMRTMLKASYDAQLDIQRAIRQEVAAAINNAYNRSSDEDGASSNAHGMLAPEAVEPYRSGKCTTCLELDVDTVLYKCGHMCVCYGCGMNLKAREAACPLCRAPIRDIIRIYR